MERKQYKGTTVEVRDGGVEKALRKFKKKVVENGLLNTLREKEFYVKPTTRRKQAKAAAKSRLRKQIAAQKLPKKLF